MQATRLYVRILATGNFKGKMKDNHELRAKLLNDICIFVSINGAGEEPSPLLLKPFIGLLY
jgi:hypothetical protein